MKRIGDGPEIPAEIDPAVLEAWEEALEQLREEHDHAFDRISIPRLSVRLLAIRARRHAGDILRYDDRGARA